MFKSPQLFFFSLSLSYIDLVEFKILSYMMDRRTPTLLRYLNALNRVKSIYFHFYMYCNTFQPTLGQIETEYAGLIALNNDLTTH